MKINIKNNGITFEELINGEVFQFGCDIYIKIDKERAYNLNQNYLSDFGGNVTVRYRRATLNIE